MTIAELTAESATTGSAPRFGPDVVEDRRRAWDVMRDGGVVIIPGAFGYGFAGMSPDAAIRINRAKQRPETKRLGMPLGDKLRRELHIMDDRKKDMIECLTKDFNLIVGVIGKYDPEHPMIKNLDPMLLKLCTHRGTIGTLCNSGSIMGRRGGNHGRAPRDTATDWTKHRPVFATSANLTVRAPSTGSKISSPRSWRPLIW